MPTPNILILRAPGINCDEETAFAWESVGAKTQRLHVNRLCENPALLDNFQALTIPGGFSYGDDIASGKILANQMRHHLGDKLLRFIERGGLVLGICNGFQVITRLGLLPGPDSGTAVTLALNESGRYEDRWVYVRAETDRCPLLVRGEVYRLPVAHGEGRIVVQGADEGAAILTAKDRVALRYVARLNGSTDGQSNEHQSPADQWQTSPNFPENPNGSIDNVAGLIDSTGRVFGLMPHPERCIFATQPPTGSPVFSPENEVDLQPDGLRLFQNAIRRLK